MQNDKPPGSSGTEKDEPVVSTREAAEQLGVSVRTIQLWVESGRLAAWKTAGNHRRIYQWSVDAFKQDGQTSDHDSAASKRGTAPNILIVEDDKTTQVYYESMLQLLDIKYDVHFAADGVEGLISVGQHEPWLLILDIDMPRMNGIEMVKSLQQQPLTQDLQIIIVTNTTLEEAKQQGLPDGFSFYSKPISVQELQRAIVEAEQKRTTSTPGGDQ